MRCISVAAAQGLRLWNPGSCRYAAVSGWTQWPGLAMACDDPRRRSHTGGWIASDQLIIRADRPPRHAGCQIMCSGRC